MRRRPTVIEFEFVLMLMLLVLPLAWYSILQLFSLLR